MFTILAKALSSLLTLCLTLLLLLTAYVGLGQYLLSFAGDYRSDIEQRLSAALGQQVQIGSVEGSWRRFNPVLSLQQVLIFPANEASGSALQLDHLSLELGVAASIVAQNWSLAHVSIQGPELTLAEQADGSWQLQGFEQSSDKGIDLNAILQLVSRVGDFSLNDLHLVLQRHDGRSMILDRGRVRWQSRGDRHFLHADAWQADAIGPLSLAAELSGNHLNNLHGNLYLLLPPNDYSDFASGVYGGTVLSAVDGTMELWVELAGGKPESVRGTAEIAHFSAGMSDKPAVSVNAATTRFFLRRQVEKNGEWEAWIEDLSFVWNGMPWRSSNFYARLGDGAATVIADSFNVNVSLGLVAESGLLGDAALERLREVNPRGELRNLELHYDAGREQSVGQATDVADLPSLSLKGNVVDGGMDARRGAPALWGVDGYAEMYFDGDSRMLTGMAEVDSNRFTIHLPDLFEDSWSYDHVNGRVKFAVNLAQGLDLRLASSVITAESDIIDGRVQFATHYSHPAGGERSSTLDLLVGGLDADLAGKSLYLPTGPKVPENARNVMSWLESAVVAGHGSDSGLIYRGSVLAGSRPQERTLQMYYHVNDGTLQFDPQWPALEELDGRVVIRDRQADIRVDAGQSLGMDFARARASIRPDESGRGSWVSVTGAGSGGTGQGMQYLQETPVTRGFSGYLSEWQATGNLELDLDLRIPLGVPDASPQANVGVRVSDSTLLMPDLDLDFRNVDGALQFDTATGLHTEQLSAVLFNQPVDVVVRSEMPDGRARTQVDVTGAVSVEELQAWPRQTEFVKTLLARAQGTMDYSASVLVEQSLGADQDSVLKQSLTVNSDLQGVTLSYPAPFQKGSDDSLALQMAVDFNNDGESLQISVGDIGSANLRLADGSVRSGLVFLGARDAGLTMRRLNSNAPGIDILGSLRYFNYDDWIKFLRDPVPRSSLLQSAEEPPAQQSAIMNFANLHEAVNAVDITIDQAVALGQEVDALNLQIASEESEWRVTLGSEAVRGSLRVPYDNRETMVVALDHLRLPAPLAEETEDNSVEQEGADQERVDPLQDFDPRQLPRMRFSAAEVRRGDADYGSWQFNLTPGPGGVEFTDLIVMARGLRVGKEGEEARFVWSYDNDQHNSFLSGVIEADNIATVLSGFGYAPSLESSSARFQAAFNWPGSPAFFSVAGLSGSLDLRINEGRFLEMGSGAANSALKLISIINFDALVRRLRFSDDLLRRGLSYEQIYGSVELDRGIVHINDRLQIIGPASLFQVAGSLNLPEQTIDGSLYITLPVSDNIPWMSGIAVLNNLINWQVAVGVFLFDQIFGDQVDSLTSAEYTLQGPWEGLEPKLKQVFGTPPSGSEPTSSGTPAGADSAPDQPATPVTPQ